MSSIGVGDLLAGYTGSLSNSRVKSDIQRLTTELATGLRSDLKEGGGADLSRFANLSNTAVSLKSYGASARTAAQFTEVAQTSLGVIRDLNIDVSATLLRTSSLAVEPEMSFAAAEARGKLETVLASLNTRIADRTLFAGTGVDGPALADAQTILADLGLAVAATTTAADAETAIDAWFDTPGGGFETVAYLGSTTDLAPMALGVNEAAEFEIRADDQEIRNILKGYAMASLVDDGLFPLDQSERADLLDRAGERLLAANDDLNNLRANLGIVEAEIEEAIVRNTSETAAIELAQSEIVAADPFRAASDLATAETQLEMLYAITARLSRLTLVDYLR